MPVKKEIPSREPQVNVFVSLAKEFFGYFYDFSLGFFSSPEWDTQCGAPSDGLGRSMNQVARSVFVLKRRLDTSVGPSSPSSSSSSSSSSSFFLNRFLTCRTLSVFVVGGGFFLFLSLLFLRLFDVVIGATYCRLLSRRTFSFFFFFFSLFFCILHFHSRSFFYRVVCLISSLLTTLTDF